MYTGQPLKESSPISITEFIFKVGVGQTLKISKALFYELSLVLFFIKHFPSNVEKISKSNVIKKEKNLAYLLRDSKKVKVMRIEICSEKMNTLLADHLICAADIRCLDRASKQSLQELCLSTCLSK